MGCGASADAAVVEVKEEETPKDEKVEDKPKDGKPGFKLKKKEKKEKPPPKPKKFEGKPYGDLPPHHPAAVQALQRFLSGTVFAVLSHFDPHRGTDMGSDHLCRRIT